MPLVDEIVVGVVILIGVIGAAIQIYPGSLIVAAAVVFWGVMAGVPWGGRSPSWPWSRSCSPG